MEEILIRFGLPAVFLGATLDNDVVPILAGVLAHWGYLDPTSAFLAGALGALAGDCAFFTVGWRWSARARHTDVYRRLAPRVQGLVGRVGAWELLAARVVYGIRYVSMLYWGIQRLAPIEFVVVDAIGCAAWVGLLTSLGFFMSETAREVIGEMRLLGLWMAGALILGVAGYEYVRFRWGPRLFPNAPEHRRRRRGYRK
jgi:membrane protein DedA with SNARE-associated domain